MKEPERSAPPDIKADLENDPEAVKIEPQNLLL
jgi:hypothetical protein